MSRTTRTELLKTSARAQQLAQDGVTRYFAGLAAEMPSDVAPGGANIIDVYNEIRAGFLGPNHDRSSIADTQEAIEAEETAAANAGYLIGVEIGRRLGGVR